MKSVGLFGLCLVLIQTEKVISKIEGLRERDHQLHLQFEWEIIAEFMKDQNIVTLFVEPGYSHVADQILIHSLKNYRFGVFHYNNVTMISQIWQTIRKAPFATIKRYGVIIVMRDIYTLDQLVQASYNNKVVLIFFDLEVAYIKKIMANLWKRYYTYNILGLSINNQRGKLSNVFINHNPFLAQFNEYAVNEIKSSKQFGIFIRGQFRYFLSNMSGYGIRVFIFEFPLISKFVRNSTGHVIDYSGVDGEMLKFCKQFMNFTPIFVNDVSADASSITSLTSVSVVDDGRAEVGFNGRYILDVTHNNIVYLQPFDKVPLRFMVPILYELQPLDIFVLYCFSLTVKLFVLVSFIVLTLIWMTGVKLISQNAEISILEIPFTILALLQGASTKIPKKCFNRMIFIATANFGLLFTSIYQGTIVRQLNNPLKPLQINSLKDLMNSNLSIGVLNYVVHNSKNQNKTDSDNLLIMGELGQKNVVHFNSINEGMDSVAYNNTIALLLPSIFHGPFSVNYFSNQTGRDLIHSINEVSTSLLKSYIVARNSPYIGVLNHVTKIFIESGAMRHQVTMSSYQQKISYIRRVKKGNIPRSLLVFRPIILKDVILIEYYFLGGMGISVIVFFLEHLVHFVNSKFLK